MRRVAYLVVAALLVAGCSSSAQSPAGPSVTTPAGWRTYSDSERGFAVAYPPDSVVLPEPGSSPRPPLAARVRFMNAAIAGGAFADREPPQLTVDTFDRGGSASLRAWLEASGRVPSGALVESISVAGALEAVRVSVRQALAPNTFAYAAGARYIHAVTPVGEIGDRMAASFRLVP